MKRKLIMLAISLLTFVLLFAFVGCEEPEQPDNKHIHSFSQEWTYDAENHWHECTAQDGGKSEIAPHNWDNGKVATEATETTEGTMVYTCTVCGQTRQEILHAYGNFIEEIAPTCTSNGVLAHYHCQVCGKNFDASYNEITDLSIPSIGHHYVEQSVTSPTTISEGTATYVCSYEKCDSTISKKILMLPTLTLTDNLVTWNAIDNADGYIVCTDSSEEDVGRVTAYSLSALVGNIVAIRAYPAEANKDYVDMESFKSKITLRTTGANTQALLNGDMELPVEEYVVANNNGWGQYPYGNWSQAPYYIVNDGGNMCGKIVASTWYPGSTKLQKDLSNNICKAGSYRLSFDVKLSYAAKNNFVNDKQGQRYGHLDVGLWTGLETYISLDSTRNNILNANCDTWTNFTFDFTLSSDCGNFIHLCVTYWPEVALTDNYVFIDNIMVQKVVDGQPLAENIDKIPGGDFEKWATSADSLKVDSWLANNTILVEGSASNSSLIKEEDGNTALKINCQSSQAVFNVAGNPSILGKSGLYEMTFRLKKGAGLITPNFSFEMWSWAKGSSEFALVDRKTVDITDSNDQAYTEYKVKFASKGMANCDQINICFRVGQTGNSSPNQDKYIIIDDISIYSLTAQENQTMNILMIGNSFMDDTIEYVYRIADNVNYDKELNLYGLFIGGCTIDTHWYNFENSLRVYDLRKWDYVNKKWETVKSVSIQQALNLHDKWDYISFQQASKDSGNASTFTHLKDLTDGIRSIVGNETEFGWLGTWAYTTAYGNYIADMVQYGMDQMTMYNAICTQIKRITEEENIYGFTKMVPSGTAVQNMRTAFDDKDISRDERHLSFGIGRCTSSMTFAAKVLGIDISQVTYRTSSMTAEQLSQVIEAVNNALANPYSVTSLTK